jgi:hypothetical protein
MVIYILFVFQSHFIGLPTIYGKLHILLFAEQEIPEKTAGKIEENKAFTFSNSKEGHAGSGIQKQTFLLLMLWLFHQLLILLISCCF